MYFGCSSTRVTDQVILLGILAPRILTFLKNTDLSVCGFLFPGLLDRLLGRLHVVVNLIILVHALVEFDLGLLLGSFRLGQSGRRHTRPVLGLCRVEVSRQLERFVVVVVGTCSKRALSGDRSLDGLSRQLCLVQTER